MDQKNVILYVRMCIHTHIHTHNEKLLSYEKEGYPACVTTWMNLQGIRLNEISQKEKDKYCMVFHVEAKKGKKTDLIETENRIVVVRG